MKWIIIGLLSLFIALFDYKIGLEMTRIIYGDVVYKIMTSLPFSIIYFVIVFIMEILIISLFQKIIKIRKIIDFVMRR
ncbi:hypothetical protein [Saccharolobus caldissimus]|uniref:Uncharacterized protein n=1 Tax=Saccharolobus caldissimus TaxID=1702097 RepID=A0AAQ4CSM8_9CREN|nr:hypothetical protein [Saccharolobus caldissimus]BDB98809.1 hypothetical protein SACC_18260 [Saccharolobus caldissimus]